jgi:ribosomal protein L27
MKGIAQLWRGTKQMTWACAHQIVRGTEITPRQHTSAGLVSTIYTANQGLLTFATESIF